MLVVEVSFVVACYSAMAFEEIEHIGRMGSPGGNVVFSSLHGGKKALPHHTLLRICF